MSYVEELADGILARGPWGAVRLRVYDSDILRVTYSPTPSTPQVPSLAVVGKPRDVRWELRREKGRCILSTDKLRACINLETGLSTFYSSSDNRPLLREIERRAERTKLSGESAYSVELVFSTASRGLYGLGQHPGIFNYRGRSVVLSQGNTEVAVPLLVSNDGWGILWDNCSLTRVASFKMGDEWRLAWWSEIADVIDYYLLYGPSLDRVIAAYRQLTGAAPLLPKWAYGYWQSKERYASQEELLSTAREFRRRRIPADIIVQDWKYWGRHGWNAFKFDEESYPDPREMVRELHRIGFKLMISIWPRFGVDTEVYRVFKERGLILPGTTCYDPFSEEGRELYWSYIKRAFLDIGVDAWWLDATEPETADPEGRWGFYYAFHDTRTAMGPGARYLNAYSLMTCRAVYEGQRSTTDRRVLILTRSAFAGQQRYAAVTWSGDIWSDWLELRRQLPAGLNFCLSGLPYWTTDCGGFFSGDPSTEAYSEVFVRWLQWSTFCPIMRVHGTLFAKEPWRFGREVEEVIVKYIKLRYRLLPYIYSLAWRVYSEGYTMMRPLVMDFPHDEHVLDLDDEYMFGPAILVCPVTEPAKRRRVYLPPTPGGWYDFWSGERLEGGRWIDAEAPLDKIPLYIRAGSVLPLGPVVQYVGERAEDPIELRVYLGARGNFTLYEDDGETYGYERGDYALIPIEWDGRRLIIGRRRGRFPGMLSERTFRVVVVRRGRGIGVEEAEPDAVIHYDGSRVTLELD